jgi:extracellular factor (EF) 3-hydroxypalmitic acid methyl ester biosynthesis protein
MTLAMPIPARELAPSVTERRRSRADLYVRSLLDRTSEKLQSVDVSSMNAFSDALDQLRLEVGPAEWTRLIGDVIAPHPIITQLRAEPFTRRAFDKPRGYAGDAVMMDMLYRDRPYDVCLTHLGAALHAWIGRRPAAASVLERRAILAAEIDAAARRHEAPRVLSIACGHLREAQASVAVQSGAISELVALDQDAESLAVVDREQHPFNVRVNHASVRHFVRCGAELGEFDFVYSAGLYDYLDEESAKRVTEAMFRALRPGGRLLVANFAPELRDIGYMEAVMDWRLIYRDERAIINLAERIPSDDIVDRFTTRDRAGNVVYMTIDRVGR